FEKQKTKLMGLRMDRMHSHIAWVNAVDEKTGVFFDFTRIADLAVKVGILYGVLHAVESETVAVHGVFVIDPTGNLSLIVYYPINVGRDMDEIKRSLLALQTSDEYKVPMPLN